MDKPRRLGFLEKRKLNKNFDEVCEKMNPDYMIDKKKMKRDKLQLELNNLKTEVKFKESQDRKTLKRLNDMIEKIETRLGV